ncbi:MAG: FtsW/RodA/SpoVE family cell cycle protein, partial [Solobacterium sp.]|nr:FtsW/RodA/SpoVE family cell cycle protein [Solobacterium sp.]
MSKLNLCMLTEVFGSVTINTYMTAMDNTRKSASGRRRFFLSLPPEHDAVINRSIWFLAFFGLLMIASASMGIADGRTWYLLFTVAKQVVFLTGGVIAMNWLAGHFNIRYLQSENFPMLAILMGILLLACLLFREVGGARAWIRVPISSVDISIQPSEFSKIMIILVVAAYCGDIRKRFPTEWAMLQRPAIFVVGYMLIVLVLQKDLGSMAVMAVIGFVCVEIPSHPQMRKFQRGLAIVVGSLFTLALFMLTPWGEGLINHLPLQKYQINRILSSINPFIDQYNTGYQLINGLVSFATGGVTGLGFGNSVRKYTRFPAANTDFILAIVVEELGYIGFLMIFIPY